MAEGPSEEGGWGHSKERNCQEHFACSSQLVLSDRFWVGVWQLGHSGSIRHLFLPQVPIYKVGINISTDQGSRMVSLDTGVGNVLDRNKGHIY